MKKNLAAIACDPNLTIVSGHIYEHNTPIKLLSIGSPGPNYNGDAFSDPGSGGDINMDGDEITESAIDAAFARLNSK